LNIIPASFEILSTIEVLNVMRNIELYGRVCYKSEDAITNESATPFIRKLIKSGHESVIEHEKITVKIISDRGVTHEIIRHRIASYSQESTRYCNYTKNKFGNELTFIKPCFWAENSEAYFIWRNQMAIIEESYIKLISMGISPEQARSILPNSLKTELIVTMNLREWRHFFKLRTSIRAHPQMREISIPLLKRFQELLPAIFDDIDVSCDTLARTSLS
jgi:thymidylate synthase (FAD)